MGSQIGGQIGGVIDEERADVIDTIESNQLY